MSDDLIRRSDAIKTIEAEECLGYVECKTEHLINQIRTIETIKPKRGEWIFKAIFPNDKSEFPMGYLECSVCGSHHSNSTPCNYCDNCGADMRGKDDERRFD